MLLHIEVATGVNVSESRLSCSGLVDVNVRTKKSFTATTICSRYTLVAAANNIVSVCSAALLPIAYTYR